MLSDVHSLCELFRINNMCEFVAKAWRVSVDQQQRRPRHTAWTQYCRLVMILLLAMPESGLPRASTGSSSRLLFTLLSCIVSTFPRRRELPAGRGLWRQC